jgi:hypothetical protein
MRKPAVPHVPILALSGLLVGVGGAAGGTLVREQAAPAIPNCSQECLSKVMAGFKSDVIAKRPIALAPTVEVRENMGVTTVEKSAWKDVKAIRSTAVFADAVTGNVVSRDGVELNDGKPAYLSTRLRVDGGAISEVEISSDLGRVNSAYVWALPPLLTAPVPQGERMTREALDALAHRYFQSLTDHKGVAADFDDARCNRFHSGNQVTNVKLNRVESQGPRTCFTSLDGPKPWGPATEQRFPMIDVDRGIVLGLTLLMYSDQVMYVSEIFKVEKGRITHIDNIGLVRRGLAYTTGFGARK